MSRHRQELLGTLGALVRRHQRAVDALDEAVAAYLGINRTDLRCLDVLLEQGRATAGYLAEALGLTTGSITAMLDRLERLDYVQRTPDPADRRRVEVRPTAKVVDLERQLYGPLVEEGLRGMRRYTMQDLQLFVDFLQRDTGLQAAHTERIRRLPRV
jgi:DNA-binding MarR family transcriptional regulator